MLTSSPSSIQDAITILSFGIAGVGGVLLVVFAWVDNRTSKVRLDVETAADARAKAQEERARKMEERYEVQIGELRQRIEHLEQANDTVRLQIVEAIDLLAQNDYPGVSRILKDVVKKL